MQSGSCTMTSCQCIAPLNMCSASSAAQCKRTEAEGDKMQQCCDVLNTYNLILTLTQSLWHFLLMAKCPSSADTLMVEEERISPSIECIPELKLPPCVLWDQPSEQLLEYCHTGCNGYLSWPVGRHDFFVDDTTAGNCVLSSTKKSQRPTSQLKVVVAACMTLATHADEMLSHMGLYAYTDVRARKRNGTECISYAAAAQPSVDT